MNTTTEAIRLLEQALDNTGKAEAVIGDLIAAHDYQDVAQVVAQAAKALLECTTLLMQNNDVAALDMLENAEDLIDMVYVAIDADLDEDE